MMMKDWSMGVRAGLNRADAEFEKCRRSSTAHTRSSRLATVISKISRLAKPFGVRRPKAPDPLGPAGGEWCFRTAPHRRMGRFSPEGEPGMVAIPNLDASPGFPRIP